MSPTNQDIITSNLISCDSSKSLMMTLRLKKFITPNVKKIVTIIGFILIKCWPNVLLLTTVSLFILIFAGFLWFIVFLPAAVLYFLLKLSDIFIYHPDSPPDSRQNVCSPQVVKLPFTDLYLTTDDDVKIHCIFIQQPSLQSQSQLQTNSNKRQESPATFVYLHGNAGNIGHRLVNVHELFHHLNCNILLIEYRGYGYSQGKPSEKGLYLDAKASIDYLFSRNDIDKNKIILYGRSLGAAVAINLATDHRYSNALSCLIIENTFTSIPEIARILFNNRLMRLLPDWLFGSKYNSLSKIDKIQVPILFLSGLADELIPSFMMTQLFQTAISPMKTMHTFQKGTHNFTWKCEGYYQIITAFLDKVSTFNHENNRSAYIVKSETDFVKSKLESKIDDHGEPSLGIYQRLPV